MVYKKLKQTLTHNSSHPPSPPYTPSTPFPPFPNSLPTPHPQSTGEGEMGGGLDWTWTGPGLAQLGRENRGWAYLEPRQGRD